MVKGHNKRGGSNDPDSKEKAAGQIRNRPPKEKSKEKSSGRSSVEDPSGGRKKKNNV